MSRYLCTYEERSTKVVGDAYHTYISGQQNKVKRVAHVFFSTEALRAHWTCVQLAVYFSLRRFEFAKSKVAIEGTMRASQSRIR